MCLKNLTIEIGKAKVTREGEDLTIVAIGKMVGSSRRDSRES